MSPYTIPDLVNMVIFAGGIPVFVDFEPKSTEISLDHLNALLNDSTAAVLVTHYHVNQARLMDMVDLCKERGVLLAEDCAISLGGSIDGISVGTQSSVGVFSLSSYKFLNFFWGGMVYCRDTALQDEIENVVKRWRRLGFRDYRSQIFRTMKYDFATRPLMYRLVTSRLLRYKQRRSNSIQMLSQPRIESDAFDETLSSRPGAAALSEWASKISNVGRMLQHRRRIASIYVNHFSDIAVGRDVLSQLTDGCFVNFPVWVGAEKRNHVYRQMILQGYDLGMSLYPNVHSYPKFQELSGRSDAVEELCRSVVSLPCHPRVNIDYAERLSMALKRVIA
jgi:dTDP-4-amino-4,6-dideoxygalactose transaminase